MVKPRSECKIAGCPRKRRKGERFCPRHWGNLKANTRRRRASKPRSVRLLPARVDPDWLLEHALTEETRLWLAQREDRAELALEMLAVVAQTKFGYARMLSHSEEADGSVVWFSWWPARFTDEPEEISWMSWTA